MIDVLTIAMVVVAIILCANVAWLYLKRPEKKSIKRQLHQEYGPPYQEDTSSYQSVEKKTISKPTKPFHPELLKDYKINTHTGTTFKGNAKTHDEIKNDQRKRDWNN